MKSLRQAALASIAGLGPRFLPFADVASDDLPLGRLLRLSLFQVSVGMALVLLVGTLNRVMIVELSVPSAIVGLMISLPLLFAPVRALIGFRSDHHRSQLGWRRTPFIWRGTLMQFGGFAVMPMALLVLAGKGHAADAPAWIGLVAAAFAFLMVGAGAHIVQTVGLALATDLAPVESQPRVVGLMYVMLLAGMIVSALIFGWLLIDFSPGRLVQVIQGAAVVTLILNVVAIWKQEPRNHKRATQPTLKPRFADSWRAFLAGEQATRRLVVLFLGTMGFGMADVLLEPYGGQVLGLDVATTTKLTAAFAAGGVAGLALASRQLGRGADALTMAGLGAAAGLPAFLCVIFAGPTESALLFAFGALLIGFGAGLFGHGTLTATMRTAPEGQSGLALGAWGAVQATAAGLAIALGAIARDVILALGDGDQVATAYVAVYVAEIAFLAAALIAVAPLMRRRALTAPPPTESVSPK